MWWVLYGKTRRNIASFNLFDYAPGMPRRMKPDAANRHMKNAAEKEDYDKAAKIKHHIINGMITKSKKYWENLAVEGVGA